MYGVLNEVYLQNFLHRWVVNRETNLMSLFNPSQNHGLISIIRFVSRFTTHLCKNFVNRLHLVLQINKIPTQKFLRVELNTA